MQITIKANIDKKLFKKFNMILATALNDLTTACERGMIDKKKLSAKEIIKMEDVRRQFEDAAKTQKLP